MTDVSVDAPVHDFGIVKVGKSLEHTFVLRNHSPAPVRILQIEDSCSCTVAKLESMEISARGQMDVLVTLTIAATHRTGSVEQSVHLYTDAPGSPQLDLKLLASVVQPVAVHPERVFLGRFTCREFPSKSIKLTLSGDVQIQQVSSSSGHLQFEFTQENGSGSILLSITPDIPAGPIEEKLTISYTASGEKGTLEIPVAGEVVGEVDAQPARLFFGVVYQGESPTRKLKLVSTIARPFSIRWALGDSKLLVVAADTSRNADHHELIVQISPASASGVHSSTITIGTTASEQHQLEIPVHWITIVRDDR